MKPGTFTQMYIQLVFAVKSRNAELHADIQERVFKYISKIVSSLGHKAIIVNGVDNHIHILLGLNPTCSIFNTVYDVKRGSSLFINNNNLCANKFEWQSGYGGFTYSRSQLDSVYQYILNQKEHHKEEEFKVEYLRYLQKFQIDYDERYLFDFWEDN